MPKQVLSSGQDGEVPADCWLVRRHTAENVDEYVARNESTALIMWDYMQRDLLFHGPTPVQMALVWRQRGGQERTLASIDIRGIF